MDSIEWNPSMYTTSSIKMVVNGIDVLKEKLRKKDHLINFFEDELFALELEFIKIKTQGQNIRMTMIDEQNRLINLRKDIIKFLEENKSILMIESKIKEKEFILKKLNLELLKEDLNLQKINYKIKRIYDLIETRKTNLFNLYCKNIKCYLIDEE